MKPLIFVSLLPLALGGCVVEAARTAVDIVTLPVKVVAKGVDLATTSQSEADENRGRALRKAEEDYGKRTRAWQKQCKALTARGQPCPSAPVYASPEEQR